MSANRVLPYNSHLKPLARELRKNMTYAEVLLWQKIRKKGLGFQFHRQVPILEYIVDFYCHELMLALEIDGTSHDHPDVSVSDLTRQKELEKLGVNFIRFEDTDIKSNLDRTVQLIEDWIQLHNVKS